MLRRLRRLFVKRPLDPVVTAPARDLTFRVMGEADIPTCVSLYLANEAAGHFPPGWRERYDEALRTNLFLNLIAIRDGEIVGCGGMAYEAKGVANLCFGMVAPPHQRRGIGTALLLTRMALLTPIDGIACLTLHALPESSRFYRRFGFLYPQTITMEGLSTLRGHLHISEREIEACRRLLAERRIFYPAARASVPWWRHE